MPKMRDTLLIIHILAAATWIGGSVAVFFLNGKMRRSSHEAGTAFMQGFEKMSSMFYPPAAGIVLLSGILLVIDSSLYDFEHAFVVTGIAMFIVGVVLGTRVFDPLAKTAQTAHAAGDEAALDSAYQRFVRIGALEIAALAFTVIAMVTKLGAT
jgi:uncharacterized membrane protein